MTRRRVAIVGGGIGGLVTALCLAKENFAVDIYEQADAIEEVGAGIQLSPNCTGVLHALGLEPQLRQFACLPAATEIRDWRRGQLLASTALGQTAIDKYGAPYYHLHRADLMRALVTTAATLPNIGVHTHSRVSHIEALAQGVRFVANHDEHEVDALIGADGIHSSVRQFLFGSDHARFTGNIAWRALVPAVRLPQDLVAPVTTAWWGPHRHFVHYFVRGGELLNCVGVVEKRGWETESWTEPGDHDEIKADFKGWHPTVETIVDQLDELTLFKWALFDRAPMRHWSKGHITLLGDACHPTLPFMAQGAAMAIEDAAVLAHLMAKTDDIPKALGQYETARQKRTARIQRASRRNATIFHLSGP
ncbi:MAG: FAD-dependent monooxygenase, partial [Pseudomonadales bacterium]